ncbi:MAG: IclR family transcriptional regulator C-terminal domain-containing protein, partial [Bryobacteraceae bacterium]
AETSSSRFGSLSVAESLGLRCLGAPVFDGCGTPVAAVSISGNTLEIHSENMATLAAYVLSAAHSISTVLGQPAKEASGVQTAEPNAGPSS